MGRMKTASQSAALILYVHDELCSVARHDIIRPDFLASDSKDACAARTALPGPNVHMYGHANEYGSTCSRYLLTIFVLLSFMLTGRCQWA